MTLALSVAARSTQKAARCEIPVIAPPSSAADAPACPLPSAEHANGIGAQQARAGSGASGDQ